MKSHRLLAIVGAIACSVLVVVPQVQSSPAQAAANLQTGKSAPGELLAGDPLTYTLTASNPGASSDPLYNLTFRDVLPLGVTYAGPTSPAEAGEPQIVTNQVPDTNPGAALGATIPQQTLIWSNVSDLQADDDFSITFAVNVNSTGDPARNDVHVIGAQISNVGESYAGTDPRRLPTFSTSGEPIAQPTVVSDPSDAAVTTLTALQIDKSEPSPEGELLRGVHDQTTTYTLTVDVTDLAPVSGITVTDYIPAALEFLGCGTVDNSAPGTEEYLNSGRLTNGNGGANCLLPDSVETVEDPPADGATTYPAGVYTKVTWTLPTLTAGVNVPYVITYAAGIPLFENRPFTGTVPTPQSRQQGSNLDNNTGPSTRELAGSERAVTNIARAVGTFDDAGLLEPGVPNATVADDARLTRTVEDLRIRKTVDTATGDFSSGAEATFHVYVDTSEYMSASGVVLTDIVPNGLCPLGNVAYSTPPTESQCGPSAANTPNPPFESVTLITTGTGGYTTVFEPIPVGALPANGSFDAVYRAFMRGNYEGGSLDGRPTVSGDSFTNTVSAVGTTTGIAAIREPAFGAAVGDPLPGVQDGSSATLETRTLRLSKDILPRNVTPRLDVGTPVVDRCPDLNTGEPGASADQYISGDATPVPGDVETLGFRLGDQVCFRLRVDFDSSVETRNTLVTDFIPLGTQYVNGSARATAANSTAFTVTGVPAAPDLVDGPIEFQIGTPDPTGRYVNLGGTFEVVFAVQVVEVPVADDAVIAGNLMKMRTENSFGQAQSYRDAANFGIVPPPPVGVVKGVESVDTPPSGPNGVQSNVDGVQVRQGSAVTFRIDLENLGVAEDFTNYSARELEVLDVLPAQVDCTAITSITNFGPDSTVGECLDPGDTSGDSDYTNGFTDQSVIRWAFDGSDPYALYPADYTASSVGDPSWLGVRSLFYTMTVPTPTSVSTRFDNNAGVRTYGGFTNLQGVVSPGYVPSNNIDPSLNGVSNAPDARDPSWVITPGPIVAKAGVTGIVETNNDAPVQAVPGETVTYTYGVTIPAQTTVFEGILSDALPNQVELIAPDAFGRFYPDAGSAIFEALPLLFGLSADGTLTFPATYTNATATDQRFEVVATTRVKPTVTGQPNPVTNTASFRSRTALGGQIVDATPASYDIAVRQPNPSLVKTNDAPAGVVVAGTVVQFTLRANNGGARPPLHDGVIVDCIPAGLAFTPGQPGDDAPTTGPVPGDGTNGCPAGTTLISYDIGTVEPATPVTREYSATVEPTAVGGDVYRNDAELTGSTLDDGTNDPTNERVITTRNSSQVTVPGAGTVKSVTPERATIGEQVTYTVGVVVPQDTNFYQGAIRDALPPGIDIDTIQFVSADCAAVAPNSCALTSRWLPPVSTADGGSLAALYVGDVTARPYTRVVTLVYTARLKDIAGSVAGSTVVNRAQAVWDSTDKPEDPNVRPDGTWTNAGLEGSASVTVIEPSVTIDKTVSDASPEPGDPPFLYTLTLRNGPTAPANASDPNDAFYLVSAAYNGTLVDTVPAGVEVVTSSISDGGVYDATARTITWDASDLQGPLCGVWAASAGGGAGQGTCIGPTQLDLTYSATLAPSTSLTTGQVLTNTADVTRYDGLPTSEPDANRRVYDGPQDSQNVTPDFPVLTTTKTASGEPTYIGDQYRWTVSVQNTGTGRAVATQITDTLPPNWTYVANSAEVTLPTAGTQQIEPTTGSGCVGADLCWPGLVDLAPGQTVSLTYLSVPGPNVVNTPGVGAATPHVNSATATAADGGGYAGNLSGPYASTSTASTRIDRVDLAIDKSHTGSPIAGSNFSWSIVVRNLGPDAAVGSATKPFTVTDTIPTLPAGVTYASASGTGWSCTPATGPASPPTTGTVTCRRTVATDTLASGASFPAITFTVRIPADTPDGTLISNTASVASPRTYEAPTDLANNTDTDTATIITRADLRIVKTVVSPPGLIAGTDSTYNLAITNLGPSVSRATATQPIVVSDTLPPTVSFVSATDIAGSPTFSCTHDGSATGGVVTCIRPTDMAVTSVATSNIRIVVRVP
ncbi:MAG: hypothetical protein WCA90_18435, partial [Ilumatobacteraceae bacterium]